MDKAELKPIDQKVRDSAIDAVAGLLRERWPAIIEARNQAAIEHAREHADSPAKFRYPVKVTVTMEPAGNVCRISAAVAFSIPHADDTGPITVSDEPTLFDKVQA